MAHLEHKLGQLGVHFFQSLSNHIGSFSSAVYDTAWVSMVQRDTDGTMEYVFPEAFQYLLKTQLSDGSWPSYSSITDGILNTMTGLLALRSHSGNSITNASDIEERCDRAERALRRMIEGWDVHSTERVGLEILVPAIIRLLGEEGIYFEFPGLQELSKLGEYKLAHLGKSLQGKTQSSLLHSLEAFIGNLDFDSIQHHRLPNGSMLHSPSSTAAYLIHASLWDEKAEAYLRAVIDRPDNEDIKGGVPSAYPTSIFELTWITTTLLKTSFSTKDFEEDSLTKIAQFLSETMQDQNSLVGFAPSCLPDADDTAKTLLTLRILNQEADYKPMLNTFEKESHFLTYPGERNPSFSANCNVLTCLLESSDLTEHASQIAKCVRFLDDAWRSGKIQDKWNISPYYSNMLLAQAFTRFIGLFGNKQCKPTVIIENLLNSTRATLLDMYIQIIESQEDDGSWALKHEVTAYATLALSHLLVLPWPNSIKKPGISSLSKGNIYLRQRQHMWRKGDYLWIEKVAYSSANLCYAYCLAAANLSIPAQIAIEEKGLTEASHFFSTLPTFCQHPQNMDVYLMQSSYFVSMLRKQQHDIFPQLGPAKVHQYLDFIPFTWIGCNHQHATNVPMTLLWEMMVISMLNYQVDLYMESFVAEKLIKHLNEVRQAIDHAIISASSKREKRNSEIVPDGKRKRMKYGTVNETGTKDMASNDTLRFTNGLSQASSINHSPQGNLYPRLELASFRATLTLFITRILQHPLVLHSPPYLQKWLASSLHTFLQAHITQIEDCSQLSRGYLPRTTYYDWIHRTSADHTSCPYSFVFYLCLLHGTQAKSGSNRTLSVDPFQGAKTQYVLEDACRRLAAMCRQQNDLGSVKRDRKEGNLNGADFTEFQTGREEVGSSVRDHEAEKAMIKIVEYEHKAVDAALAELRRELSESTMTALMLFFHVTNLFGEIYITRDMSPPIKSIGIDNKECEGA